MSASVPRVAIEDLRRDELAALAPRATAVIPTGATEQHGPHLPLGTDFFLAEHFAAEAARTVHGTADVLVTPGARVGYSEHHFGIGPALSVDPSTLERQLLDICTSLHRIGFRRVFILNGHGGNAEVVTLVARQVGLRFDILAGAGNYWQLAAESIRSLGTPAGGHAGILETSLIMALRPELVGTPPSRPDPPISQPPSSPGYYVEEPRLWKAVDGYTQDPSEASAQLGERLIQAIVADVAGVLKEFATRPRLGSPAD